jgi:hypothetical protein
VAATAATRGRGVGGGCSARKGKWGEDGFYRGCLCHCDVAAGLTTKPGPATVISFDCLLRKQGERVERKGLLI